MGGVLWLIRDGKFYLEESIKIECFDIEEIGERGFRYRMFRYREKGLNIEFVYRKKGCI